MSRSWSPAYPASAGRTSVETDFFALLPGASFLSISIMLWLVTFGERSPTGNGNI